MSFREQTVAEDRGLFGVLTHKITLRKDLRLAEQSTVAQHKLIGFYNRDEKCLQRGTDWVLE